MAFWKCNISSLWNLHLLRTNTTMTLHKLRPEFPTSNSMSFLRQKLTTHDNHSRRYADVEVGILVHNDFSWIEYVLSSVIILGLEASKHRYYILVCSFHEVYEFIYKPQACDGTSALGVICGHPTLAILGISIQIPSHVLPVMSSSTKRIEWNRYHWKCSA